MRTKILTLFFFIAISTSCSKDESACNRCEVTIRVPSFMTAGGMSEPTEIVINSRAGQSCDELFTEIEEFTVTVNTEGGTETENVDVSEVTGFRRSNAVCLD